MNGPYVPGDRSAFSGPLDNVLARRRFNTVPTRQVEITSLMLRFLLYAVAGAAVGFLFLGEFGLRTFVPLMILVVLLALGCLIAAVRRNPRVSPWAIFLVAAMIAPLLIDSRTVGLPKCSDVAAGVACFAGSRDYQTPFLLEVLVTTIAAAALAVQARQFAPRRSINGRIGV